jgi:hypothetical protein
MCLILLWAVAGWLQAQTVPALTPVAASFKTVDGKEYKDATVSHVEPDGIVLRTRSGISKVYFVELPKEVQESFHYDAAKAAQFATVQEAAMAESNAAVAVQQQEEAQQRQHQAAEIARQQQEIVEQQGRADAILVQQQQRHLEAQQKQTANIAAQKQAREQNQGARRTTGGSWENHSYANYGPYGSYEIHQESGDARIGSRHTETQTPRTPLGGSTHNVTDESWWRVAPKRNKAKKHATPSP